MHVSNDQTLNGYTNLEVNSNSVANEVDNSFLEILAVDALDKLDYENVESFLGLLVSKLRLNGKLVLGGYDFDVIARRILTGSIDPKEVNHVIGNSKSVIGIHALLELLTKRFKLSIDSAIVKGYKYEITAVRK